MIAADQSPGPVEILPLVVGPDASIDETSIVVDRPGAEACAGRVTAMVLADQGERRARALLAAGAKLVYVGAAALRDAGVIERLVAEFGARRIGVHVPAKRMEVRWTLDAESNADFKVMAPSILRPSWEILDAGGVRTGTLAPWWIGEMFKRGASAALVQVDVRDDWDLECCAALAEQCGPALRLGPLADEGADVRALVTFGKIRGIVVPARSHPAALEALAGLQRKAREASAEAAA